MTYAKYKMPAELGHYEFVYKNWYRWWRHHWMAYEEYARAWLMENNYDEKSTLMDVIHMHWWWEIHTNTRAHITLIGGIPFLLFVGCFPFVSMCCFCYCCCTGSSRKAKKPVVAPTPSGEKRPAASQPAKNRSKRSSAEKLD